MAQLLRALSALPEHPSSALGTHVRQLATICNSNAASLCGHLHPCAYPQADTYTYTQLEQNKTKTPAFFKRLGITTQSQRVDAGRRGLTHRAEGQEKRPFCEVTWPHKVALLKEEHGCNLGILLLSRSLWWPGTIPCLQACVLRSHRSGWVCHGPAQ